MAQSLVQAALDQHAPALKSTGQAVRGTDLWLGEREPGSTYRYTRLAELLLRRFNEGLDPAYADPASVLVCRVAGTSLNVAISPANLRRLGTAINDWGDALLEVFKAQLVAFWSEAVPDWAGKVRVPRPGCRLGPALAAHAFALRGAVQPAVRLDVRCGDFAQ
ncbi:hypothetical protein QNM99_20430 [Pseudomonas sp. PCH446]